MGASAGLAAGGLVVTVGGVFSGALAAFKVGTGKIFGVKAFTAFVVGALAFNQFAFITAPILGVKMDGIEYEPNPTVIPKPGLTPKHPYEKNRNYLSVQKYNDKLKIYDLISLLM